MIGKCPVCGEIAYSHDEHIVELLGDAYMIFDFHCIVCENTWQEGDDGTCDMDY